MNISLKGKKAFVCGSTQGIGKAAAVEIAALGANVVLVARNEDSLKLVLQELDTSQGQKHSYIAVDFSNPERLQSRLEEYVAQDRRAVHILVNNTGGPAAGRAIDDDPQKFIDTFNAHLVCNQILAQALVPGMRAEKYGRIINIISTSVKQPIPGLGVSNTIRGAVASWAKTLAGELAADGITVNNVLPGSTMTGRLQSIIETKAKKAGVTIEEMSAEMQREVPAGRFGTAEEIANAIAFLASPAAAYINGINLPVDGGRTSSL